MTTLTVARHTFTKNPRTVEVSVPKRHEPVEVTFIKTMYITDVVYKLWPKGGLTLDIRFADSPNHGTESEGGPMVWAGIMADDDARIRALLEAVRPELHDSTELTIDVIGTLLANPDIAWRVGYDEGFYVRTIERNGIAIAL